MRRKKALVPLSNFWGDYGTFPRPPEWMETRMVERFERERTLGTHGVNLLAQTVSFDKLGKAEVKAPPYGPMAIGSAAVGIGAGVAAWLAPVPTPVKVLFGAISAASSTTAIYSTAKYSQVKAAESRTRDADQSLKSSAEWFARLKTIPKFAARIEADKIQSYMNYNKVSPISKFIDFDTLQAERKDPVTGEGADIYYDNYPEWVDKNLITVGETDFHRRVHNWLNSYYAGMLGMAYSKLRYDQADVDGFIPIEDPEAGVLNNYGLLNRDAWIRYRGADFFACATPPVRAGWPRWYHIKVANVWAGCELETEDWFINGENFQHITKNTDEIPDHAVIIGSRFYSTGPTGGGVTPCVCMGGAGKFDKRWFQYDFNKSFSYEDIFNGLQSPEGGMRPDLWYFSRPLFPAGVTGGKFDPNVFPFIRKVNCQGAPSDFIQSGLFQPSALNCRFICFQKSAFMGMMMSLGYESPPAPDSNWVSKLLKAIAIVIVIVAAVVVTVVTWGTDTVPAWATAVSLVAGILAQGLNLAAKYIENPNAFTGSILEGVVGLWNGVKGPLQDTDFELDSHFGRSAAIFTEKVRAFTGRLGDISETQLGQIKHILKTTGNDLVGGWGDIEEWLAPVMDLPFVDESTRKKIQDAIVLGTGGTEEAFRRAKDIASREVKGKITELNNNLNIFGVDRLAILY